MRSAALLFLLLFSSIALANTRQWKDAKVVNITSSGAGTVSAPVRYHASGGRDNIRRMSKSLIFWAVVLLLLITSLGFFFPQWLREYEPIAVWLEGIALVAIFIWDRIDGLHQRREAALQLKAAHDQIEATQKPCVVFSTAPREPMDAILEMGGTDSAMVVRCPEALAQLENIGSGPAVNIRYALAHTNHPEATVPGPSGYLVGLSPAEKFLTPISRNSLLGTEWRIAVTYESLSGRRYKTETTVNNLVLTNIRFE